MPIKADIGGHTTKDSKPDLRAFMSEELRAVKSHYGSDNVPIGYIISTMSGSLYNRPSTHRNHISRVATQLWQILMRAPSLLRSISPDVEPPLFRHDVSTYIVAHGPADSLQYDLLILDPRVENSFVRSGPVELSESEAEEAGSIWKRRLEELSKFAPIRNYPDIVNGRLALEIAKACNFGIVYTGKPEMIYMGAPTPRWLVTPAGMVESMSTAGSVVKRSDGKVGVTIARHTLELAKIPVVPSQTKVEINSYQGIVESEDILTDSCFVSLYPSDIRDFTKRGTRGPLTGVTPRGGGIGKYEGIKAEIEETTIIGWNEYVLTPVPYLQAIVLTTPDTEPGDSGTALIDEEDHIIGFCTARTGVGERIKAHSAWMWADLVYKRLGLTDL